MFVWSIPLRRSQATMSPRRWNRYSSWEIEIRFECLGKSKPRVKDHLKLNAGKLLSSYMQAAFLQTHIRRFGTVGLRTTRRKDQAIVSGSRTRNYYLKLPHRESVFEAATEGILIRGPHKGNPTLRLLSSHARAPSPRIRGFHKGSPHLGKDSLSGSFSGARHTDTHPHTCCHLGWPSWCGPYFHHADVAVIASAAAFTSMYNCDTPSVPDHNGRLNSRESAV